MARLAELFKIPPVSGKRIARALIVDTPIALIEADASKVGDAAWARRASHRSRLTICRLEDGTVGPANLDLNDPSAMEIVFSVQFVARAVLQNTTRLRRGAKGLSDGGVPNGAAHIRRRSLSPVQGDRAIADFTYVWTAEGWLYVAAVIDLFSRRVVGWSMSAGMTAQLVTDALVMAIWRRGRPCDPSVREFLGGRGESFERRADEEERERSEAFPVVRLGRCASSVRRFYDRAERIILLLHDCAQVLSHVAGAKERLTKTAGLTPVGALFGVSRRCLAP